MPIDLRVPDADLVGFSDEARGRVKSALSDYSSELIEEANRIEAGRNSSNGPAEVTRGIVDNAVLLLKNGLGAPKKQLSVKLWRIAAAILLLLVGLMYDTDLMRNKMYMGLFTLIIASAIIAVSISYLKE